MTIESSAHLVVLDHDECVRLLQRTGIGRLAWSGPAGPALVPINYAWTGTSVVFRTDPGAKLDDVLAGPVVFEIDEVVDSRRCGWSVVVAGHARLAAPGTASVTPWVPGPKGQWVEITPSNISGRRVAQSLAALSHTEPERPAEVNPYWRLSAYS